MNAIGDFFANIGNWLNQVISDVSAFFNEFVDWASWFVSSFANNVVDLFFYCVNWLRGIFNIVLDWVINVLVNQFFSGIVNEIMYFFKVTLTNFLKTDAVNEYGFYVLLGLAVIIVIIVICIICRIFRGPKHKKVVEEIEKKE